MCAQKCMHKKGEFFILSTRGGVAASIFFYLPVTVQLSQIDSFGFRFFKSFILWCKENRTVTSKSTPSPLLSKKILQAKYYVAKNHVTSPTRTRIQSTRGYFVSVPEYPRVLLTGPEYPRVLWIPIPTTVTISASLRPHNSKRFREFPRKSALAPAEKKSQKKKICESYSQTVWKFPNGIVFDQPHLVACGSRHVWL